MKRRFSEQTEAARQDFKIMCFWLFGTFIVVAVIALLFLL